MNGTKRFNVTAVCRPEQHYMVNLDQRLKAIKQLVDATRSLFPGCVC